MICVELICESHDHIHPPPHAHMQTCTLHCITLHSLHIASHHITSHYITSHHITSHYITLHYITLHYITSHHITSHHITSHHITLHHITYITLHCSCSDEQKQYLIGINVLDDLLKILDNFLHDSEVICEAFGIIACLADMGEPL